MGSFSSFLDNLQESKSDRVQKEILFSFMRANPATKYHSRMAQLVEDTAAAKKVRDTIFLSGVKKRNKRDPFKWEQKTHIFKSIFPKVKLSEKSDLYNLLDVITYLSESGYTDIIFVGSYEDTAFIDEKAPLFFDKVETIVYEDQNPDNIIAGLSGDDFVEAVMENNIGKFRTITGLREQEAVDLFRYAQSELQVI